VSDSGTNPGHCIHATTLRPHALLRQSVPLGAQFKTAARRHGSTMVELLYTMITYKA